MLHLINPSAGEGVVAKMENYRNRSYVPSPQEYESSSRIVKNYTTT
jgi:hypothetical protein